LRDRSINGVWGKNFADMCGNFTLAYTFQDSTGLTTQDQSWTGTDLRWDDFIGTGLEGTNVLDRRSTISRWGNFTANAPAAITSNGIALTSAAGFFHVQPVTNPGCGMLINDTNAQYPDGRFWELEPKSHTTWNVYIKYSFAREGLW